MKLDTPLLFTFALVFVRCSAMLLASPVFGGNTPVTIRVGFATMVSAALTPVMLSHVGHVPTHLYDVGAAVVYEALVGILIGATLHALILAAQMAGAFLDIQVGLSSIQVLNPQTGNPVSLFAQFKYFLAIVLLLLVNGHHAMFQAFVHSYEMSPGLGMASLPGVKDDLVAFVGQLSLLSLQIAAPVAAVCVVVDAAAGIVNKSVPQMQAFLVTLPAKILLGILALSLGLPLLVVAIQNGVEHTFDALSRMLAGR